MLSGNVLLTAGTTLDVLVGGQGSLGLLSGGGGGGSFVFETSDGQPASQPLIAAGGGGGGASGTGGNAQTGVNGGADAEAVANPFYSFGQGGSDGTGGFPGGADPREPARVAAGAGGSQVEEELNFPRWEPGARALRHRPFVAALGPAPTWSSSTVAASAVAASAVAAAAGRILVTAAAAAAAVIRGAVAGLGAGRV